MHWGPNGKDIFDRTYARPIMGRKETWDETVDRVVRGNLALVAPEHHLPDEEAHLRSLIHSFGAIPAGRHLWVTGVPGRQFNRNCHRAGWGPRLSDHFTFLFSELMKGGGVGANYSTEYLADLPPVVGTVELDIRCRWNHPNLDEFKHHITESYGYWDRSHSGHYLRVPDTREGWVQAVHELVEWHTVSGDHKLIIDVSAVRPRGEPLRTFGGVASGPGPLVQALVELHRILGSVETNGHPTPIQAMEMDHALSSCVVAGNVRRSARMSIIHWRDPHVMEFIHLKQDSGSHWSTNISVEVDEDFFRALDARSPHAEAVFSAVVRGMHLNGEPGFYNSALASEGEEGDVRATNPCGEIALEPWESCNLGHVNLAAFGTDSKSAAEAFRLMTRFLIRATFAELTDPRQAEVEARNRRIGVGFFGFQEWALSHGVRYSDIHHSRRLATLLERFKLEVGVEAALYAQELGIPIPVKTTTVAPTGTIAKLPGVTEGIHAIYARYFERRVRYAANDPALIGHAAEGRTIEDDLYSPDTKVVVFHVRDTILDKFPEEMVEQQDELGVDVQLATQAFVQEHYANNAVSFTANIDPTTPVEDLEKALLKWLPALKGTTVFPDLSRPQSPYTRISRQEWETATDREIGQGAMDCSTGACPVR